MDDLRERLKEHNAGITELLSKIPSKFITGEEMKNQWLQEKQTKEQSKKKRKAKFEVDLRAETEGITEVEEDSGLDVQLHVESTLEDYKLENDTQNPTSVPAAVSTKSIESVSRIQPNELAIKTDDSGVPPTSAELRAKLRKKIQELREKRKAPGTAVKGAPLNRQALIEMREQEKQKKRKRKLEKDQLKDLEIGQTTDNDIHEPVDGDTSIDEASSIMYNTVTFEDGTKTGRTLDQLRDGKKKKGPPDIIGQLRHLEAKKKKLATKDEEQRKELMEKDKWHKALLQTEGIKVRDQENLLKKAAKRIEKRKNKSKKEWDEREKNVKKSMENKQKKRERNLAERREQKLSKNKKKKRRPGFEGGPRKKSRKR
ncbi:hypothetical protein CANCADRAFT_2899 [Tortispora caseinolytica NRRL Y-17796]|uniref:Ribosomal RNA-processing protein 14/surfeit locus protein 6 C-terminal domain-containing protein n=1 Tax=Tortispora caseinolytica NRRL Y-17796 TaxID=767744 RepID=A0A1E4THH1_9ASCO|nr:hypothetical protein CANCADRAFT_2899 [Tortispora caseinolytica NRRL Y-17796]